MYNNRKEEEEKFNPIESTQVSIVKLRIDPKGKNSPLEVVLLDQFECNGFFDPVI